MRVASLELFLESWTTHMWACAASWLQREAVTLCGQLWENWTLGFQRLPNLSQQKMRLMKPYETCPLARKDQGPVLSHFADCKQLVSWALGEQLDNTIRIKVYPQNKRLTSEATACWWTKPPGHCSCRCLAQKQLLLTTSIYSRPFERHVINNTPTLFHHTAWLV